MEFLKVHIREHTDVHGIFHINAGADAACHIHCVDHVHGHIHGVEQGFDGGENGALGPDEVVDVHLVQRHLTACFGLALIGNHKSAHAVVVPADAAALPDEQALGVDNSAPEKLGNQIDDTGAADAHALLTLVANDGELGFHGFFIDGHGFHSAVGGPHTAGDVAAFKGGTCGTGTGHEEIPVAEYQLAVGAKVDEQAHFVPVPHTGGQGAHGDVAADVGANVGGNENGGQGVGRELQVPGQQAVPMEEAGHIGLHADALSVHAHEKMVHGGVGTHGEPQNGPGGDACGAAEVCNNGGQGLFHNGILEPLFAALLALLDDAVDDIGAVADLAVAGGTLGQNFSVGEVRQDHGNGGGANVDGAPYHGGVLGGADFHAAEGIAFQLTLDADVEVLLPENVGKLHHDAVGDFHICHPKLLLDGPAQALVVGHGVVQRGLCHKHFHGPIGIFKMDAAVAQILLALLENGDFMRAGKVCHPHSALIGAGNVGDENGAVAADLAAAGESPALVVFFLENMVAGQGLHLSRHQFYPALAAGAVAGAGSVNGHVGPAGQLQQIIAVVAVNDDGIRPFNLENYLTHENPPLPVLTYLFLLILP